MAKVERAFTNFRAEESVDAYFTRLETQARKENSFATVDEIREHIVDRVDDFLKGKTAKDQMVKYKSIFDFEHSGAETALIAVLNLATEH